MKSANRLIFRRDALRRYRQGREKPILLRYLSPPTFVCLWIILGLLVAAGCVAWFAQVPVYVSGSAVVINQRNIIQGFRDEMVLVAFLPPEALSHLRVGQMVWLTGSSSETLDSKPIIAVEPQIMSPEAAQTQFVHSTQTSLAITQPVAVVIARFEPFPSGQPASLYTGSVYHVAVEVGSQRVLSLLPSINHIFER